ncbi:MAG: methyl-accepting chemotaxis protein, partial [Lysobacteraceae bacterium]
MSNMFKHLTIKTRLIFVIVFLAVELVAGAVIGLYNLGVANADLKSLHDDRVVPIGQLSRVLQLITTNQLLVGKAADATTKEQREVFLSQLEANVAEATATWKAYEQTRLTPEETTLVAKFVEARKAFLTHGLMPAVAAASGHASG